MRAFFIAVAALAAILLAASLAGVVWTALDLADGTCDECGLAALNEPRELVQAAIVNVALYGGLIAFSLWRLDQKTQK